MTTEPFTVRRIRAQDWAAARDLRLEMLADTPIGFLETHEQALRRAEADWRAAAARDATGGRAARFVAVDAGDRMVATAGAYVDAPGTAYVVAVFVQPAWRGRGVLDALLAAVEDWARSEAGVRELRLYVHEGNARARAAYARAGFVPTGATTPYELDPSAVEVELRRPVAPANTGPPEQAI